MQRYHIGAGMKEERYFFVFDTVVRMCVFKSVSLDLCIAWKQGANYVDSLSRIPVH